MTVGAARLATLSEAADLVLKGGGILAIASVVGSTAFKFAAWNLTSLIIFVPMLSSAFLLWAFAGFLLMLASLKLEDAFQFGQSLPAAAPTILGYTLATLIVFSMGGLLIDLAAGVMRQ
ncbi:hypothetical protein SAMN04488527_1644 [Aliiroseovarius crassostreae]|nr:hypothetical protein SAMN04488527_1644 [Aliiroseovarius crassostreae]